jgi:hypothetical protein
MSRVIDWGLSVRQKLKLHDAAEAVSKSQKTMPRARPVVPHAAGYKRARHDFQDATGLSRGVVTL